MLSASDEVRFKALEDRISFLEELEEVAPPKLEKWYENIPEGGVIGFAIIRKDIRHLCVIKEHSPWLPYPFILKGGGGCDKFEPLTEQEKQTFKEFMDNAS
ncbi:MAG: hypothetical protein V3T88_02760 [Nitrosomonadaceae bacterium]